MKWPFWATVVEPLPPGYAILLSVLWEVPFAFYYAVTKGVSDAKGSIVRVAKLGVTTPIETVIVQASHTVQENIYYGT